MGQIFLGLGIGDIFKNAYETDIYTNLSQDKNFEIVFIGYTNTQHEILDKHPNRKNFNITTYYEEFFRLMESGSMSCGEAFKRIVEENNLNLEQRGKSNGKPVWFSDYDVPDCEYAVIHPFSTGIHRKWSKDLTDSIVKKYAESYEKVFIIGKSNSTYRKDDEEYTPQFGNDFFLNSMKLNDIIKLIQNCKKFIGTDSGFANLAVREGIDSDVIINKKYIENNTNYWNIRLWKESNNCNLISWNT